MQTRIPHLLPVAVRLLGSVAVFALSSLTPVQADPTVEGLTILLPDDGWYQVQNREDYAEVCAGVRSCVVPPGHYIVINHTTGERFENVTVPAPSGNNGIVVTQDVISWPDDGWYQVQHADTFKSVCEGGRSCMVDNGPYIVINHTTGQRWENIIVDADQVPVVVSNLTYERYSSSAIELFWLHPASGVPAGGYSVYQDGALVEHTTGTSLFIEGLPDDSSYQFDVRHSGQTEGALITVPAADNAPATLSIANAAAMLENVVSVINEDAIEAFYQTAIDDELFQGKRFFISNTSADIQNVGGGMLDTPYQVEITYGQGNYVDAVQTGEYSCAGGGALVGYFANSDQASDWVFDDCVIGSNTYSGTAGSRLIMRGAINRAPVYALTIEDSNGQARSLSGGYSSGNLSFVTVNAQFNWDSAIYRGPADDGQLEIDTYTVSRTRRDDNTGRFQFTLPLADGSIVQINEYTVANTVAGSFTVKAPWTQNASLAVTVDLSFSDKVRIATDTETGAIVDFPGSDPEETFYWQSGSISISAEDGSTLQVTPAEGQRGDFLILTSHGETLGPLPVVINP